jgi:hypothetical protein
VNTSRRGLFGLLIGAAVTPAFAKLQPYALGQVSYSHSLTLSEIVTETLRARSGIIAASLMKGNALLDRLERSRGAA